MYALYDFKSNVNVMFCDSRSNDNAVSYVILDQMTMQYLMHL